MRFSTCGESRAYALVRRIALRCVALYTRGSRIANRVFSRRKKSGRVTMRKDDNYGTAGSGRQQFVFVERGTIRRDAMCELLIHLRWLACLRNRENFRCTLLIWALHNRRCILINSLPSAPSTVFLFLCKCYQNAIFWLRIQYLEKIIIIFFQKVSLQKKLRKAAKSNIKSIDRKLMILHTKRHKWIIVKEGIMNRT